MTDSSPPSGKTLEILLVFLLFYLFAGWLPPEVNEPHYLGKAKHYWNSQWCGGDPFLESADAHEVFYWSFGWVTQFLTLPQTAWVGRLLTWALLAWAWVRLSRAAAPLQGLSVLTAAMYLVLLKHCHMAGEWVVGGVEAKGFAYVLVFLGLEQMLRGNWNRVWLLFGAASSFHVIVGGWAVLAGGVAWLSCGKRRTPIKTWIGGLIGGGLLALPGLLPALLLNYGAEPETVKEATKIYVYDRLPHHLVFHKFPHLFMIRHGGLFLLWIIVGFLAPCRIAQGKLDQRPLRGFVGAAAMIAILGIIIDQSLLRNLETAGSLLRYYWYRLSDAMLPLGVSLGIGLWLTRWRKEEEGLRSPIATALLVLLTISSACVLGWDNYKRRQDPQLRVDRRLPLDKDPQEEHNHRDSWLRVCHWVRNNTPPDAMFLTPLHQQTFKWRAQRPELFCWKDIPQDAAGLVQWQMRLQDVKKLQMLWWGEHYLPSYPAELSRMAEKHQLDYVLIQCSEHRIEPPGMLRVYPLDWEENQRYAVYRFP